jgi:hypothetical protein
MRRVLIKHGTRFMLALLAFLARRPGLQWASDRLTRSLARLTVRSKGLRPTGQVAELGPLWQRSFPSAQQVPIESVTDTTLVGQIHTRCPLRGSGDLQACQRMMEFDREVLRQVGGQFVVLQSQASPGVSYCRVAMRLAGQSMADLPAIPVEQVD